MQGATHAQPPLQNFDGEYRQWVIDFVRYQNAKRPSAVVPENIPQRIVAQSYNIFAEKDSNHYGYVSPLHTSAYDYDDYKINLAYPRYAPYPDWPLLASPIPGLVADSIFHIDFDISRQFHYLLYYDVDNKMDSCKVKILHGIPNVTSYEKWYAYHNPAGYIDSAATYFSYDGQIYESNGRRYVSANASGQILTDTFYVPNNNAARTYRYHYNADGNVDSVYWSSFSQWQPLRHDRIAVISYDSDQRVSNVTGYRFDQGQISYLYRHYFEYTNGIEYATFIDDARYDAPNFLEAADRTKIYKYARPDGKPDSVVYYILAINFLRRQASYYTYNVLGNPQLITHYAPINYGASDTLMGYTRFYYDHGNETEPGPLSIGTLQSSISLKVYPNPCSTVFQLKGRGLQEPVALKLYDISGKEYWHLDGNWQTLNQKIMALSPGLTTGVYTLVVTDAKGKSQAVKLLKQSR